MKDLDIIFAETGIKSSDFIAKILFPKVEYCNGSQTREKLTSSRAQISWERATGPPVRLENH